MDGSKFSQSRKSFSSWMAAVAAGVLCVLGGVLAFDFGTLDSARFVQAGTELTVRLDQSLTSQTARLGDVFGGKVVSGKTVNGTPILLPELEVEGRCVAVRAGEGAGRPGYLRLALSGVRHSGGRLRPLETTTFTQWGPRTAWTLGNQSDAVLTPEARIAFVLLKPIELRDSGLMR